LAFYALFLRFALSGFCPQRFGVSAPPECLLFCSFGGPAPSVVFLFLLVAVFGTGPLLLVTAVGVCL
jgi:hypothetical protein